MAHSPESKSGWSEGPRKGSLPINGGLMQDLRKARGLTQEQLADLTGYSPRLIRKAEASKSLRADTIEVIAAALSTDGAPVSPETLASDLMGMVRSFAVAYAYDERQLAAKTKSIFATNVTYKMAGDPNLLPFAGEYKGIDGVDSWARDFFSTFDRPIKDLYQPKLYQSGSSVLAVGHDAVLIPGDDEISHSMTVLKFDFERGKIVFVDNDYDTQGAVELLQRHQAKQAAQSNQPP